MVRTKMISIDMIPKAVDKALRYRLLNEPLQAESICRDVLGADPNHQPALRTLLLALTDQFETKYTDALNGAQEVLAQLTSEYDQAYHEGIIHERWGLAQLANRVPGETALGWLRQAMRCYEKAEMLSEPGDPDAVLRWNTCARFLAQFNSVSRVETSLSHDVHGEFGDDVPLL